MISIKKKYTNVSTLVYCCEKKNKNFQMNNVEKKLPSATITAIIARGKFKFTFH